MCSSDLRAGHAVFFEPPVHRVGGDHQVDGEESGGQYRAELPEQAEGECDGAQDPNGHHEQGKPRIDFLICSLLYS